MSCLLIYGDRPPHRALRSELNHFVITDRWQAGNWTCVFRWGSDVGNDKGQRVINTIAALRNSSGPNLRSILHANKIALYEGARPRWRVYLFDLRTIAVLQAGDRRWRKVGQWTAAPLLGVRDLARRALYAVGLHFGAVEISGSEGNYYVVRILTAPPLDGPIARSFARAMTTYAGATRTSLHDPSGSEEVVLGADPEFILRNRRTGRTVSAARFFTRWGVVGLDRIYFRRNGVNFYPLAEVRPPPSADPLQLVENLRRAIARAAGAVRGHNIRFEAGGTARSRFTLGGHIHFSNVRLTTDLLHTLDNYLALPVLFLENPVSCRLRRPRYGYLGDWRPQPHGGFEYRTPGSWMISPQYAAAVLCLAKAIVQDYPLLRRNVLVDPVNQQAFYRADKATLRPHFWSLWQDLQSSPVFREFKEHIELIHQMVSDERRWNERVDLKRRWLAS